MNLKKIVFPAFQRKFTQGAAEGSNNDQINESVENPKDQPSYSSDPKFCYDRSSVIGHRSSAVGLGCFFSHKRDSFRSNGPVMFLYVIFLIYLLFYRPFPKPLSRTGESWLDCVAYHPLPLAVDLGLALQQ